MIGKSPRGALLASPLLLLAHFPAAWSATHLPVSINSAMTLVPAGNPYLMEQTTRIYGGGALTCLPGSIILASPGARLEVYGRLIANGTLFRAVDANPTTTEKWGGLYFLGATAGNSALTDCRILQAGRGQEAALYFTSSADASVMDCEIAAAVEDGVECYNASPVLSSNIIRGCGGAAIRLRDLAFPTFPAPNTFTGNHPNATVIDWRAAPSINYTLPAAAQPYLVSRLLLVEKGRRLTIEPGCRLFFPGPGTGVVPYGTLSAEGTASEPIILAPLDGNAGRGAWGGVEFRGAGASNSALAHCTIDRAGGWSHDAAVQCTGVQGDVPRPTLRKCKITRSGGDGIRSNLSVPKLDGCEITDCAGNAIIVAYGGIVDFISPCSASGNRSNTVTFDQIGGAVVFPQQWNDAGLPYAIEGTIVVQEGGRITIGPGADLRMGSGVYLVAGGGPIQALGTAAKPITMRGLGASGAGVWSGLYLQSGAGGSVFRHCDIRDGGAAGAAHLMAIGVRANDGVQVEDCTLTDGAGAGLWLQDTEATITGTTIRRHRDIGIATALGGSLTVRNCRIERNGQVGVYITGTGPVALTPNNVIIGHSTYEVVNNSRRSIPAQQNYWGTTSSKTIANRLFDGRKQKSLGLVNYTPFRTSPPGGALAPAHLALTAASATATARGVQVTYALSAPANVRAEVLNMAGRPIRRLAAREGAERGLNVLLWDGRSDTGLAAPAGRYLVRLRAVGSAGEQAQVLVPAQLSR